ncbi:uncharacterized protein LOC114787830 [Denticeps clupeoides]|uniref:uncharacterized protein LOC114787830 n=1 Tax=Denticeps clupeoides TaxID=299321 RepID=UPI0010A46939|nr:uncharacterized protein LOC114787830 [Denticeps clupeoides]
MWLQPVSVVRRTSVALRLCVPLLLVGAGCWDSKAEGRSVGSPSGKPATGDGAAGAFRVGRIDFGPRLPRAEEDSFGGDYQADAPAGSVLERVLGSAGTGGAEAAWLRLRPALQCGQGLMKLSVRGPGSSQLQVEAGNAHSLPLTQLPPYCRYLVYRTPWGLVFTTPYDGCNVVRQVAPCVASTCSPEYKDEFIPYHKDPFVPELVQFVDLPDVPQQSILSPFYQKRLFIPSHSPDRPEKRDQPTAVKSSSLSQQSSFWTVIAGFDRNK